MRKHIFTLLVTLSILLITTANLFAMGGPSQDGSTDHPYLIEDFNDFQTFCADPNYRAENIHTQLTCNLDLDPNLAGRMIYTQAPIAGDTNDTNWDFDGTVYAGNFDGNGHVISNLTVDGGHYCGLFGKTDFGSSITDLSLENASVTGSGNYVAALVVLNYGSISESFVTGTVTGDNRVGGLVGENYGSITSSYSTGEVNGNYNVGGLVGRNYGGIISGYSTGAVTGNYGVGGLVGENDDGITSSYSTGTVTGNRSVGGLVGRNYSGSITSSYSTGAVTGIYEVGGLVGENYRGIITSSYLTGAVTGNYNVGGLVGLNAHGIITSSFWNVNASNMDIAYIERSGSYPNYVYTPIYSTAGVAEGKTTLEMQIQSTFTDVGWDFVGERANGTSQTWQMPVGGGYPELSVLNGYEGVVLSGDGSKENPYLIGDANDLGAMVYYDTSGCYELIADINLAGIQWQSAIVPCFAGHFDGEGYVISNMNIDGGGYLGLFGRLYSGAEVENIGLESVMVTCSGDHAAGLVGVNYGSITSGYSSGEVNGDLSVGGLVGENSYGSITSSYSRGVVTGYGSVGGLVGHNYYGNVTGSYSRSAVTGNNCVGGLVGLNSSGIITSDYSSGAVTGNSSVGGLVGSNYSGSITSSYSSGAVTCYSFHFGGLVGLYYSGSITSNFWDVDTSGMDVAYTQSSGGYPDDFVYTPIYSTVGVAEGKTTLEMQIQSTFTGADWDLVNVWNIEEGQTYPLLRKYSAFDTNYDNKVNFIDFADFANNWLGGVE